MERRTSGLEVLGGLVVGAAFGFVAGMILAPQAGGRTRDQLNDNLSDIRLRTNEMMDNFKGNTETLLTSTRSTIEEKLTLLNDAVEAGRKAAAYRREELIEGEDTTSQV